MTVANTNAGLILMASCRSVEQYAAGQVFYWVGFDGIAFVLDVFIADTSSLRSRALMFAFSTSPYIATTFAGPAAAQSFQQTSGWPWAYGTFAILTPVISLPFLTQTSTGESGSNGSLDCSRPTYYFRTRFW